MPSAPARANTLKPKLLPSPSWSFPVAWTLSTFLELGLGKSFDWPGCLLTFASNNQTVNQIHVKYAKENWDAFSLNKNWNLVLEIKKTYHLLSYLTLRLSGCVLAILFQKFQCTRCFGELFLKYESNESNSREFVSKQRIKKEFGIYVRGAVNSFWKSMHTMHLFEYLFHRSDWLFRLRYFSFSISRSFASARSSSAM